MAKKKGLTLNTEYALIDAITNAIIIVCTQSGTTPGDVATWLEGQSRFDEVVSRLDQWERLRRNGVAKWLASLPKEAKEKPQDQGRRRTPHLVSPVATPGQAKKE